MCRTRQCTPQLIDGHHLIKVSSAIKMSVCRTLFKNIYKVRTNVKNPTDGNNKNGANVFQSSFKECCREIRRDTFLRSKTLSALWAVKKWNRCFQVLISLCVVMVIQSIDVTQCSWCRYANAMFSINHNVATPRSVPIKLPPWIGWSVTSGSRGSKSCALSLLDVQNLPFCSSFFLCIYLLLICQFFTQKINRVS